MANMRRAMVVLLALYSFVADAQTQRFTLPTNLTPAQREQLIQRCREYWQDWCAQLGLSKPQQSGTSDGPSSEQQESEARQLQKAQEKAIRQCRAKWRPDCEELGVPKPEPTTQPEPPREPEQVWIPPPPQPPPPPSRFECEFDWSERCGGETEAFQSLLEHGPSGVTFPDPAKFSATGFIRSGWPIAVQYQIPAGARATLTIKPQYGRGQRFDVMLPASVDGWPQTYSFVAQLPGSDGNVLVADYKITARYYVPGARDRVAPVKILGFGAGARAAASSEIGVSGTAFNAVYSLPNAEPRAALPIRLLGYAATLGDSRPLAINDINFNPPIVRRPKDNGTVELTYSYLLKNDWDRVAEDLWRSCKAVLRCNLYHPHHPYAPTSQGPQKWKWFVNRGTAMGLYQLVVRAWRTCGAVVDPNAYYQCGNSADWVIGSTGPISVTDR